MARERKRYPAEFRRRLVELVRAGRSPESLAKEFDPSANTIRKWAVQADLDEGVRTDGLTTAERAELRELRRENRQLKLEREILGKEWDEKAEMCAGRGKTRGSRFSPSGGPPCARPTHAGAVR